MQTHLFSRQKPSTILFTHYGDEWIRGSERCLLDLLSHLDRNCFKPIVWCNSETMAAEVQHIDVPVIRSDFPLLLGWQQPRFAIKAFFDLVKKSIKRIDSENVALIHANSGAPNQWLNFAARIRNIPLLTHLHSRYPLRDRMTLGLHQIPMVVGVCQPIIDQLINDGMPAERTCVIPNGIDPRRLGKQENVDLRRKLKLSGRDFLIATAGSLIHRKGIDIIIEAVTQLIKQNVPAWLVIIGEGPERPLLQQQIQRNGLSNRILLLGERADVSGLLRGGVDLFVSAAREEVFGLVLAEAGLACLPVVAPKVGGIPNVIVDGKTGKLVPAENIAALTRAIHELYLTPQQRYDMGMEGHFHVLRHFTILRNVRLFEQLYNRMLHNPAMRMHWHSHWQFRNPILKSSRQLLDITRNKFLREVIP